jgi:hypothetical protein
MEYNNRAKTVLRDFARVPLFVGGGLWAIAGITVASSKSEELTTSAAGWQLIGGVIFVFGVISLLAWLVAASTEYAIEYNFDRRAKRESAPVEE